MNDEPLKSGSNDPSALSLEETQKVGDSFSFANLTGRDLAGKTIGGYRLVRKIAEGGMGIVYEAIQIKLDRKVALKILTDQLASQPEFLHRFEREAKSAAALNHPNIVQVHDFGEADGHHYLIMELVDGEDLSVYVEQQGKLSIEEALNVIEQAAQGLKAAYEKSIIHRDVKPANLLRTHDGRVKVSDLGLAKILTEVSDATISGIGIGSPYYIAPEQADNARHVDHRVDIYALGITLLFLVTGRRPYDGNTPFSIILAHVNKPLPSGMDLGTELSEEVEGLVQRMAAKNPDDRYQNYDSLLADLQRVKSGFAPTLKLRKPIKSKNTVFAIALVAVILAAVTAVVLVAKKKTGNQDKPVSVAATDAKVASERPLERPENSRFDRGNPPQGNSERPPFGDEGPREMDRGGGLRLPMGPPPAREFYSIQDGPVQTMLAKADEYAALHKENYSEIIDGYQQVRRKAGDGPQPAVERKLNEAIEIQQKALAEKIRELEEKMQEKLRSRKPDEAYNVWKDFPGNLRTREADEQIRKILKQNLPADFSPNRPEP